MAFQPRLASDGARSPERPFNTVAVIGLGYIGLPTAAVMAARNVNVAGIDINAATVETINRGEIHIVEPLLDHAVREAVESGYLTAYASPVEADAFLIAVPTPITSEKKADMRYVMAAGDAIAPLLKPGDLIILESTSPVGSTEKLVARIAEKRPDLRFPTRGMTDSELDINVAYCPERVLPGKVVEELVANDRAIGGVTPACSERAIALYRLFVHGDLVPTDVRSAELCKLAENAFRDVNIAYANELANVCETLDMDVWEVVRLANRHPRVNILNPGPGVGGHCIAVDPWFIAEAAPGDTQVIQAARRINDGRPHRVADQIQTAATSFTNEKGRTPVIACLGVSFKANIDDIRESPALEIVCEVSRADVGSLYVVDPFVSESALKANAPDLQTMTYERAQHAADILVLLVDHRQFTAASLRESNAEVLLDFRGVLHGAP